MATIRNSTATMLFHALVRGGVSTTSEVCEGRRSRVSGPGGCCDASMVRGTDMRRLSGKIGATRVDAKHCDIRIGPRSAGCAFLRSGYFCAAQSTEFQIPTSVQCGFRLLNMWRSFCEEPL